MKIFALLLLTTVATGAGAAITATPVLAADAARSARAHAKTADAYFKLEKYKEAIEEYEKAFLDRQDPSYLFNIAECHRLLGNRDDAARFYKRFLAEAAEHPNRASAEQRLAEIEVDRRGAVKPAPLGPAMRPVQPLPPQPVAPLPPVRQPVAPSRASSPQPQANAAAAPVFLAAPVAAPAAQPMPIIAAAPGPASARTPIYKKWWFWAIIGVAVVATGAVIGVAATSSASKPTCSPGFLCQ